MTAETAETAGMPGAYEPVGTMTKSEVAKFLHISPKTVERNVKRGILPQPVYIGPRSPRWYKASIVTLAKGPSDLIAYTQEA